MTRSSESLAAGLKAAAEEGLRQKQQRYTPDGQLIVTSFDYPPIPVRCFDWSAVTENYDGAPDAGWQPVGHGATEQEAIDDLLEQIEEHDQ